MNIHDIRRTRCGSVISVAIVVSLRQLGGSLVERSGQGQIDQAHLPLSRWSCWNNPPAGSGNYSGPTIRPSDTVLRKKCKSCFAHLCHWRIPVIRNRSSKLQIYFRCSILIATGIKELVRNMYNKFNYMLKNIVPVYI